MNPTATLDQAVPERTLVQRMSALDRANAVRSKRKDLKAALKAKDKRPQMLLLDPPEYALTMRVRDMLLHVPKLGHVKVDRMLRVCRISPSKTLGGISTRQRDELIEQLTGWGA